MLVLPPRGKIRQFNSLSVAPLSWCGAHGESDEMVRLAIMPFSSRWQSDVRVTQPKIAIITRKKARSLAQGNVPLATIHYPQGK